MIRRIAAIATHTFKEAVRDRILVLFVMFAFAMMAASTVLSWLTVGSELKIVTDLGLGALALFGTMIAIFIGITLVHKEVEKKTIYAVLAKPVSRWEFLVGKYFGLMLTLAVVTGLMAVFYLALVWWKAGAFPTHLPCSRASPRQCWRPCSPWRCTWSGISPGAWPISSRSLPAQPPSIW